MTDQQVDLYNLFKEIDEICKKHNIMYYLAGGSAIGAVRHHGFIPWDDDMDIYMTRDNWLKFVEVSKTELKENRCLLCQELDHSFTNMFARYCNTSVSVIHRHAMYHTEEQAGEIIDILQIDPVPDDPKKYAKYVDNIMLYSELINQTAPLYGHRWNLKAGRYLRYKFLTHIIGRKKVLDILEKKMFSYKEEDCSYYAMRWGGSPFLFPKEWFEKPRTCKFEDGEYYIPYMNNAYLTWHYGDDWTYIPAHAERESHNTVMRLDMTSDEFRKEYNVFVKSDKKRWLMNALGTYRKAFYMRIAGRREKYEMAVMNSKADLAAKNLNALIERDKIDVDKLILDRNIAALDSLFKDYYTVQLSRTFIGREDFTGIKRFNNPCFIKLSDSLLRASMWLYIHINKIAQAERMINIRKRQGDFDESYFSVITYFIKEFRAAVNCYDLGEYEKGSKAAIELNDRYPDNQSLMKLIIRFAFYKNSGSQELAARLVKRAMELYPSDGEFIYYNARFVDRISDKEQLMEIFEQVKTMTNNGIILLEIEEYEQ